MEKNMIEVEGLTKQFKNLVAVDHVSFDVKEGEIFGFLDGLHILILEDMNDLCDLRFSNHSTESYSLEIVPGIMIVIPLSMILRMKKLCSLPMICLVS
jgi:hypothetical protein